MATAREYGTWCLRNLILTFLMIQTSLALMCVARRMRNGRAPTFHMATGYEQVRSVAAHLAGDEAAANDVRLVLPETGVCSTNIAAEIAASEGCCGGPAPDNADACCMDDAIAKADGKPGCGCGPKEMLTVAADSGCGSRRHA